jgi:hypothetical protein
LARFLFANDIVRVRQGTPAEWDGMAGHVYLGGAFE